jgi:O-antigen/teichoic acid export membrane protein
MDAAHASNAGAAPDRLDDGEARRVGRNLAALTGGQLATWTMTFVWTLVVPRALGPSGMGTIVTAWSVTGILAVLLGLGTRNYLVREMVLDRSSAPRLVGTAIVVRLLLAPLFAGAVVTYAQLVHNADSESSVLYLAAAATILTLLAEPMQAGFQSIERMEYLAYSDVINKSAQGLLGVALALIGFRAVGITASWVFVAAIVVFLDVVWLRRFMRVDVRVTYLRLRHMLKNSLAYWAFGFFFVIYLWIDAVMLSLMTSSKIVGWYGVPTRLFQTLMFVPMIVSTAWLPRLVSSFEQGADHLRRATRAPLELVLVLGFPICALTAVAARPAIHLLYGSAYGGAVPVMVILGLCVPPMYVNIILNQVLVAAKRQTVWTWVMAGATIVNPLLNALLITVTQRRYHNGAIGAAISLLFTELVIVAVGFRLIGRLVEVRPVARRSGLAALASGATWSVGYTARGLGGPASVAAAIATFVVLAAVFRLVSRDELAQAWAAVGRRSVRRSRARPEARDEHQDFIAPTPSLEPAQVPPPIPAGDSLPAPPEPRVHELPAFVLFVPSAEGYRLVVQRGDLPAVGTRISMSGDCMTVYKIGPSPLPGDLRRCVYLHTP